MFAVFIFLPANPGEHGFRNLRHVNAPNAYREIAVTVAVVLLATAFVTVVALLAAAAAGKLARMDHASYPTALTRAATTFAAVITLAAVVAGTLAALLT
ncbi:hypothetical protein ACFWCB_10150 [Streptomyces sp. NPDC060048]|uniref:hypothetical protein n=1 Tax=unclassified Streptomyces TaxID=2593676 RepID=UPI0036BC9A58